MTALENCRENGRNFLSPDLQKKMCDQLEREKKLFEMLAFWYVYLKIKFERRYQGVFKNFFLQEIYLHFSINISFSERF